MSNRPNVLLLFSDEHRHDAMGCAGHERVKTPHLDAL
ncbi:MAG: sulfatase, partial [Proteobacteria bacterium]|nr:sulfatase [Pseudomonadota bacterium]